MRRLSNLLLLRSIHNYVSKKYMKRIITLILSLSPIFAYATKNQQVENISAFAKVYGVARWFVPSDEARHCRAD